MAKKRATRKNPHAVALGRKGGLAAAGAGARVLFSTMTPEERSAFARRASLARWSKKKKVKR